MFKSIFTRMGLGLFASAVLLSGLAGLTGSASAAPATEHAVYTQTNAASGNAVLVFARAADGSLTAAGSIPTGGNGTGVAFHSQGSLALGQGGHWLLAVNAGSNSISVISLKSGSAEPPVSSGGLMPISVTVHDNWVYVLNAGSASSFDAAHQNITGFHLSPDGDLTPLAGSTQPLSSTSAFVSAEQIKFNSSDSTLVVAEKGTNKIDTYSVNANGVASAPVTTASAGLGPYGFDFGKHDDVFVSEAASKSASSYHLNADGSLGVITASASTNGQAAPCWLVVTPNAKFAYTANAGSGTITGYSIGANGVLSRLDTSGVTGTTGGTPLDEAVTKNGKFLYVLNGAGRIDAFGVESDGSLASHAGATGVPVSAAGLVAR